MRKIVYKIIRILVSKIRAYSYCIDAWCLDFDSPAVLKAKIANHPSPKVRLMALKKLGCIVGEGTYVNPGVRVVRHNSDEANLIIGRRVSIAMGVTFVCNSSPNLNSQLRDVTYVKDRLIKRKDPIVIGDDCWIGAGAVILPGVNLGEGVIVGANALVLCDCPPYTIWAGVPARMIRKLK